MSGITVKELKEHCERAIKMGYGDRVVLISDDDEGNGFHTLYYHITTDAKSIKEYADLGMFHDRNNPKDVVLLG